VQQADKLYGARHYNHYEFLLALTDRLGGIGLEHHRSSENSADPGYFTEWDSNPGCATCCRTSTPIPGTASTVAAPTWPPPTSTCRWATAAVGVRGQTQFWGQVLAARSGLWSTAQARDMLANVAATYDRGRPAWPGGRCRTLPTIRPSPSAARCRTATTR
jgi:hypothetical protein